MRILLVEDEDRIASFIAKGLTAEGHTVERAATAAEGVALARTHAYEMVLLDLVLPDAHGATSWLRSVRSTATSR